MSEALPPAAWADLPFFATHYPKIRAALEAETRQILPPAPQRFAALEAASPDDVRVVILGQDPYPTPGHAHGLAFSAEAEVRPLPRSLGNIYKEMQEDLGAAPPNADLRFWAEQGVLLLNTALSVPAGEAGAHAKLGWSVLTAQVLERLSDRPRAFLLWGRPAQGFAKHLHAPSSGRDHLILASAHPSPLSARRGFFGSRPFSKVNEWLKAGGDMPINWTHPGGHS
ncbi:uracil-DNA glycosylase [Pseudooceanicola sp. CBS1P-1]|uniref:Uracil-DNA glycosylase n=1 Tax=Pseudooceanicola albus TaxID=2692189 RepID=A0A6L7G8R6_9RHOB|nr:MULTISPECIES: uracil-DNA glycosylase [Pseudooceanicola]MBT9384475.1 uracil-DNA glycosylase [Pseudooceanicola endophyticus]MXN20624.1 uracil-DNA glycosylase [Pseudooceanicola albus]